jgi:hypothetical protein
MRFDLLLVSRRNGREYKFYAAPLTLQQYYQSLNLALYTGGGNCGNTSGIGF